MNKHKVCCSFHMFCKLIFLLLPLSPSFSSTAKQRATVVDWLNNILPNLSLPTNASDKELRAYLSDGTVLCQILNKLRPGSVVEVVK